MNNIDKLKRITKLAALYREVSNDPVCGLVDIRMDLGNTVRIQLKEKQFFELFTRMDKIALRSRGEFARKYKYEYSTEFGGIEFFCITPTVHSPLQ